MKKIKGGKEIKILSKVDFSKIEKLNIEQKYLISISQNLSIEDYIELKRRLREIGKVNKQIITEIK